MYIDLFQRIRKEAEVFRCGFLMSRQRFHIHMTKRIFSFILAFALLVTSVGLVTSKPVESQAAPTCYQQGDSRWGGTYVGNWTMAASGCGILSAVNAINYLTGNFINPVTLGQWAYQNNHFNGSYGQGTMRNTLYPALSTTYGPTYGFTITDLTWSKLPTSGKLEAHLENGGVAIVHVPNHFMAFCGYNRSTGQYLVYDSAANVTNRGTYPYGTWLTAAQLNSKSLSTVDWYCLMSSTKPNPTTTYALTASVASGSGTVHFGNGVTSAQVSQGTTVNFQVTPASGWTTSEIVVGGTAFEIKNGGGDCVYQFTMPNGPIGVVVKFKQVQTTYTTGVYEVTSSNGLNIRSAPVNGTVLATVLAGTRLTAIAITNTNWAKIVYKGQIAYASIETSYAKKINTNTVPESDIVFDTSNPVSWVSSSGTNATSVSLGTCPSGDKAMVVKTSSASNDPSFNMNFGVLGTLSATDYKYMIVTAKTSAANKNAKMYLCPGSITSATENCAASWQWTNDGLWHDYVINLSSLSTWKGNLNNIRFDYFDGDTASGATLYLRSIRFLTDAPSSPKVTTNKTTYTEGESITVSYSGLGSYTSPIQNAVPFVGLYKKGQKPGSVGSLYWAATTGTSGSISFPSGANAGGGLTSAGLTAGEYMMWIAYDGKGSASSANLNNAMFASSSAYCYFTIGASAYTLKTEVAGGSGSVHFGNNVTSTTATVGQTVNYQTTPAAGYKVSKILVNGTSVTIQNGGADCVYQFTMPAKATTVSVTFEKILYTTTAKVISGSGSVHFGDNVTSATATVGQTVNYQVTPATGYIASSIKVNGTAVTIKNNGGDYVYQFTMPAKNTVIEVTFAKNNYEKGVYEIASSDGVMSVRTAPTTGTVLAEIPNGTRITALEIVDTYWAKIIYKGQYAYVSVHTSYAKYINANTIPESDIVFDTPAAVEWVLKSNTNDSNISLGTSPKGDLCMVAKSTASNDPWFNMDFNVLGSLNATDYKYMIITAQTTSSITKARLYLSAGSIEGATEDCATAITWNNDGLWHDYVINLSALSNWKGEVNSIRLDYFNETVAKDTTIYIRSIRFLTAAPSAPKVTTNKTAYTIGESIVLNYSGLGSYGSVAQKQIPFIGIYKKGEKPGSVDSQMWAATTGTSGSLTFPAGASGGPMAGKNLPAGEYVAWIAYDASGLVENSYIGNVMFDASATSYSFTISEATYTATASVSSGSGTVKFSNGSTSITGKSGASVTYTVTPSTGYKVSSIKVNGTAVTVTNSGAAATYTLTMPAKATTVVVTFAKIQYAVSVGTVSNGTVTLSKTGNVDYNTTITVTATPATGYKLNQILVNGTAISGTTFTVTKASTVTATFTKLTYSVSVGTVSNGKVTLSKTGTVDYGTTITVTATPNTGYELNQILVNGTAISGTTFTVKATSTVTATFKKIATPTTSVVDKVGTGASSGKSSVFVERGGKASDVIAELKSSLSTASVTITKDGETVADTTKLGTGMIVTAGTKTYTVVIKGDVNGDGDVTQADASAVMADVLGTSKLAGAHKDAAFEHSGKTSGNLSILDVMALLNALK